MRFQVNEELPTIAILYKTADHAQNLMFMSYFPWSGREVESIKFSTLKVVEHYKVPNEYDTENKCDCDGYVLHDESGAIWYNQYPRASFGQLSDTANRMFSRHLEEGTFDSWFSANPNVPCEVRLLSDYLSNLERGIGQRQNMSSVLGDETKEEKVYTQQLIAHKEAVVAQYEKESKSKVIFSKLLVGDHWLEGWWNVSFESQFTVKELASKHGVSISHIRMLKRENRLHELTHPQAPKQMDQVQWFSHMSEHKKGRIIPECQRARLSIAMEWWNALPEVDRIAQGVSVRSASEISQYYWADEQEEAEAK